MAVKISKLWSDNNFINLTRDSKLFYVYLITNPSILTVGVLSLNLSLMGVQLGMDIKDIREATKELRDSGYIRVDKYGDTVYFIVPAHFSTVPKSDSSVLKINKELQLLPEGLVRLLDSLGINTSRKVVRFKEPTSKEVMDYALELGYKVNADEFISFYRGKAEAYGKKGLWIDGRGKQVKDWRAKLRTVWCRDENKLKTVDGAPKGFESFYIEFEGKSVFPEVWKDGRPYSKNMVVNKALNREYEKRKTDS